ncbi:hypothetical protein EKH55_3282 [Sinorhizobium alkalisoli]|nr:hypothetical protein EKH55_3282 [Sinorhizobium alkalisoli]
MAGSPSNRNVDRGTPLKSSPWRRRRSSLLSEHVSKPLHLL